jgi:hypothetical protein
MSTSNSTAPWWLRVLFIVFGLAGWYWTQSLIGARTLPEGVVIGDGVLDLLADANQYLHDNPRAANALLISSSAIIDSLGLFMLFVTIFGKTVRPFLGLLLVFGMRQICQLVCALPPPPGIIWKPTGVPSLLVTYYVANDFFFSGHTGLAVLGSIELTRFFGKRWALLGAAIIAFEMFTVLALRAHYTMDVFTGALAALYASILAANWAPWCDGMLARLGGRST